MKMLTLAVSIESLAGSAMLFLDSLPSNQKSMFFLLIVVLFGHLFCFRNSNQPCSNSSFSLNPCRTCITSFNCPVFLYSETVHDTAWILSPSRVSEPPVSLDTYLLWKVRCATLSNLFKSFETDTNGFYIAGTLEPCVSGCSDMGCYKSISDELGMRTSCYL